MVYHTSCRYYKVPGGTLSLIKDSNAILGSGLGGL